MSARTRPFCMYVDSGADDEGVPRYFGSLEAAQAAADALPERFQPFVWIMEKRSEGHWITRIMDGVPA